MPDFDVDRVATIRIHPAIGVARLGNAGFVDHQPTQDQADPLDFFIGPERPFETAIPEGGYKRDGRVRRQAARFRLFAFDEANELLGEVTAADADISWTVELANTKASWRSFNGSNPNADWRNDHVRGDDRRQLDIKPGSRTITGANQHDVFADGSFTDWSDDGVPSQVAPIYLGAIQSDDDGRLLVLGGCGRAGSPLRMPGNGILNYVNNDGWFDDISDGPVRAQVRLHGGETLQAADAYVLCTLPKFAPAMRNIVTLYELLFQMAVDRGEREPPGKPSFKRDIFPILERALQVRWLMEVGAVHTRVNLATPPSDDVTRSEIFERLRKPPGFGSNEERMNMPMLWGEDGLDYGWDQTGDVGLTVTPVMYQMLLDWRNDNFDDDWEGLPPQPEGEITPQSLDQAALEHCCGGSFFPGMEVSWFIRDVLRFVTDDPFRLDTSQLQAGDVSKQMAVPWQADFLKCSTWTSGPFPYNYVGWWPQQRPDTVFPEAGGPQSDWIREKIAHHVGMVDHWHELGFVVWNPTQGRFVETGRSG